MVWGEAEGVVILRKFPFCRLLRFMNLWKQNNEGKHVTSKVIRPIIASEDNDMMASID